MLEAKHISKKFGDRQVLVDVNLQVKQGDVVVILGPSGSGKTTFLRCLNHLEKADGGQLTIAGKDYSWTNCRKRRFWISERKRLLYSNITIYLQTKLLLRIYWKV